jgi:PAS domain S-box-containing protein
MNLRRRALVLSLLPLVLTLLFALAEGALQARVSSDAAHARRAALASGACRDIESSRLEAKVALRRRTYRDPGAATAYAASVSKMRSAMLQLDALAGPDPARIEEARRVNLSAARILAAQQDIDAEIRRGHFSLAAATMSGPRYYDEVETLDMRVHAFIDAGRAAQSKQYTSFERLWSMSIVLLILLVASLMLVSALLVHYSDRAVRAVLELGRKVERYRRGDPLGPPSPRHDEIGFLDEAFHELVEVQELRGRQLQRYRLLAEVTHDVILFVDRTDLTVVDANAAALEAYGYERSELIGKPTATLHAVEDPIDIDTIALSDTPAGLSYEGLHRRSDGTVFPVEVHARTADVEGRLTIIKTIRDISERRRAAEQVAQALDQAIEASRLKSEFVATVSHEIRTPMHGVIGMSELLLETALGPVQREYATTVNESARALLAIIDDILDFSKLEANKIELEAVAFDPAQLVASVVNLVRGTASDKGLRMHSYASPIVPAAVAGDPTRLRQILINLVGNAVKFTAGGSVTVSTSVEREDGHTVVLLFAVTDTGIGVSPEARERLFEAFVQGDGTTTRRFGGTGLGLSISRRLVELMGGRIWLGDHDGPGSTFCFTARFERTNENAAPSLVADGGLRVLVLDDDESICRSFERSLTSWGMQATSCVDIATARTQLLATSGRGEPFDAVLIDYILPRSDGLAFAVELGLRPEYGEPARILMTAFDADGRREAALAVGCVAYLTKPVDPSELYNVLSAIERSRGERDAAVGEVGQARILLVEDSALIRRVARFQLKELKHGVDIVENGQQAVAAVLGGDYKLVLMDMRMPEMDGLAATRAIRAAERESGCHVVIIALTANVLEGDREACVEAGMDDFLAKPMQLESLRAALDHWLPARV